jgi:hypothetical protein
MAKAKADSIRFGRRACPPAPQKLKAPEKRPNRGPEFPPPQIRPFEITLATVAWILVGSLVARFDVIERVSSLAAVQ